MTFKEKFEKEHPGSDIWSVIEDTCPDDHGYMEPTFRCPRYDNGTEMSCKDCWDREIPDSDIEDDVTEEMKQQIIEESIVTQKPDGNLEFRVERKVMLGTDDMHISSETIPVAKILDSGNRRPKIICISGKAQHGKDTTAGYLKEFLEEKGEKVLIAHYGDLVKYICKTFFDWDGQKDERGRSLLQEVGTDTIRAKTPDFWVRFIKDVLDHFPDKWDYVIIPDCRFPNEVDYLKEHGYSVKHVRVIRSNFISPLTIEQQKHASEVALDDVIPDVILFNTFGLEELRHSVRNRGLDK